MVAGAAAPESLEQRARALGMVPSETPVFLSVPSGKVLGKAEARRGRHRLGARLLTPADATVTEAVDNASVGTDLPVAPGSATTRRRSMPRPPRRRPRTTPALAAKEAHGDARPKAEEARQEGRRPRGPTRRTRCGATRPSST